MASPPLAGTRRTAQLPRPLRLFITLWPSPAGQQALYAASARFSGLGRRIPADNLHVTLGFLGAVEPTQVAVLEQVIARAHPRACEISLDRLGYFARSRILWAGAAAVPAGIADYQKRLAEALAADGWRTERQPFKLHLTLLRDCAKPSPAELGAGIAVRWQLRDIALVRSDLTPAGARYTVLSSAPAAG